MSHHFFFPGIIGSPPPVIGSHMPRPGDYTIDGAYRLEVTGAPGEINYLLDATARTAASNCDFIIMLTQVEATATSIPVGGDVPNLRFDFQGDGGSGALLTAGTSTTTAKNVHRVIASVGSSPIYENDTYHYGGLQYNHPGQYVGASDATRTGRINIAEGGAANDAFVTFIFCSWNPSSGV